MADSLVSRFGCYTTLWDVTDRRQRIVPAWVDEHEIELRETR